MMPTKAAAGGKERKAPQAVSHPAVTDFKNLATGHVLMPSGFGGGSARVFQPRLFQLEKP
jgi:hypothetical protein